MLAAYLLVLLAAGSATSPPVLEPAPGAPGAATINLGGRPLKLDSHGRGQLPPTTILSAEGFRFYTSIDEPGGVTRACYFPIDYALVSVPLAQPSETYTKIGAVVIKAHGSKNWEEGARYEVRPEPVSRRSTVRFVIPPGQWDVALLLDGYAPGFLSRLKAGGADITPPPLELAKAATLKGRILDARSGQPPSRWSMFVKRLTSSAEDDESVFFRTRPIARNQNSVEYASLPIGGWEVEIDVPGLGKRRTVVSALTPGGLVDLGDIYVSGLGTLRLSFLFPREVPAEDLVVRVLRPPANPAEQVAALLGTKTVTPAVSASVEFAQLEPGLVHVECESRSGLLRRSIELTVAANETSEAELTFAPLKIAGVVRRGIDSVAGAKISASVEHDQFPPVTAGDLGEYAVVIWRDAALVVLMTAPPEEELEFVEVVRVPAGSETVDHDVSLPANSITGTVTDAGTGQPLPGVRLQFSSTVTPGPRADDDFRFSLRRETDGTGRFTLRNLRPKPVDVRAIKEGYARREIASVMPSEAGTEVHIQLVKGSVLSGVVLDGGGAPVAGAKVGLDVASGGYLFLTSTTTAGAGEFTFESVSAGPHTLIAMKCGHTIASRAVVVPEETEDGAGGPARETITAPADTSSISVRFEDESGAPLGRSSARWMVNGQVLPVEEWAGFAVSCGLSPLSGGDGGLNLSGFPRGMITAFSLTDQQLLGTYVNDGSGDPWRIRVTTRSP